MRTGIPTPGPSAVSQTAVAGGDSTTPERPDALAALFENLAKGQTPDFLQMMSALADVSELVTPNGDCPDCRI